MLVELEAWRCTWRLFAGLKDNITIPPARETSAQRRSGGLGEHAPRPRSERRGCSGALCKEVCVRTYVRPAPPSIEVAAFMTP